MRLLVDGKFESDDGSFSRQSKTRVRCSHGEVVLGITMDGAPFRECAVYAKSY